MSKTTDQPLLELDHVDKTYAATGIHAVKQVSLRVHRGELLALVGASGSGKTTLLRLIAGLEHPDRGCIRLQEQIMTEGQKAVPAHMRHVGMVFQDYALFPHLNVLENVRYGILGNRKQRNSIAFDALTLTGMRDMALRYPHQLSGGQKQRVALARAIAPSPEILLLDEPFSNLDHVLKDQLREEIRKIIQQAGITTIFVTHDTRDALSIADRIAIMHHGHIKQCAPPKTIYQQPINPYVAHFFGRINNLPARIHEQALQTSFGALPAPTTIPTEGEVCLYFRPENIHLGDPESMPLQGIVCAITYYGNYLLVELEGTEGTRVHLQTRCHGTITHGDRVGFTLTHHQIMPHENTASNDT